MVIKLTPDLEKALAEQARKLGTTAETLALKSLRERFAPATAYASMKSQGTLADFLMGHIGVLHSGEFVKGGAQLSKDTGKEFAAGLVRKRQQKQR